MTHSRRWLSDVYGKNRCASWEMTRCNAEKKLILLLCYVNISVLCFTGSTHDSCWLLTRVKLSCLWTSTGARRLENIASMLNWQRNIRTSDDGVCEYKGFTCYNQEATFWRRFSPSYRVPSTVIERVSWAGKAGMESAKPKSEAVHNFTVYYRS